ncbi:phosphoribosylformylglycinamidine synthase subunit PurQ [Aeoliella mucimassa]|uniref:Phosphoribosylformylglycinamidine synthase n=1 Tax=Aeoliella mucimassa TaxID=2527972 RepID=A0A518ASU4_9BACT|nr:phosphoribosylformylglycinamidine synthase subunit PurQ [Aeoliella mucimassa]QDU57785.1 Phosphoribosylformylglycinamidine synthase [Aeoliella mucimassa]
MSPRVLVLRAPGTNCDKETAFAFEQAGGTTRPAHVRELLDNPQLLNEHQVLAIPGGFSYGDDIASGRILGNQLRLRLAEALLEFRDAGKLVLGICNGFQVLMKTGLLDVDDAEGPQATLAWNNNGRYEARWVKLGVAPGECVFLSGLDEIELPVAHAEGKFVVRDQATLDALAASGRLVLRYTPVGEPALATAATMAPAVPYPANPNGACGDVAGICDTTGRVLGLMPHPERFLFAHQHPQWTRNGLTGDGAGMKLFENAVKYFA